MAEFKTRVEELKMENEYQLRLKDMNYNEKIKELTEKFIQEMESLKTKNQVRRKPENVVCVAGDRRRDGRGDSSYLCCSPFPPPSPLPPKTPATMATENVERISC